MTFVETKLFTDLVQDYLSDDEYAAMQQLLVANPEAGDDAQRRSLDAYTLYAKNVADNIPAKVLKKIKEEIDAEG